MATKTPLQLLLKPAEYPCHTTVIDQSGELVWVEARSPSQAAGGRQPVLSLHGDFPADIDHRP